MIAAIFTIVAVLAVTSGGLVSAFTARKPTRRLSWLSAYLVLIAGAVQLGLMTALQKLGQDTSAVALAGFVAYNLGNIGVMTGTMLKARIVAYPALVNAGGLLLALAMVLLLVAVRHAHGSWTLAGFVSLVIVILVSMPIGLGMSAKRG